MATCRDVITAALRKLKVVYTGRSATADEAADCLESLQSWYDEFVGAYTRLEPYIVTAAYTAEENQRLQNASDYVITYPTTVEDEHTGEDRPVYDRSVVVNVGSTTTTSKVYSTQLGAWQTLTGLTLDSTAPLTDRGSDGLASLLAVRVADQFGKQVSNVTARSAGLFLSSLSMKLDGPYRPTVTPYF